MDINSLAHTKWNCKYHIVFAPKYRRKVAYGKMKQDIANILSMLCKRKGVEIVEAEICPDHVHMLVKIPPSLSVSSFVGYLKGGPAGKKRRGNLRAAEAYYRDNLSRASSIFLMRSAFSAAGISALACSLLFSRNSSS